MSIGSLSNFTVSKDQDDSERDISAQVFQREATYPWEFLLRNRHSSSYPCRANGPRDIASWWHPCLTPASVPSLLLTKALSRPALQPSKKAVAYALASG